MKVMYLHLSGNRFKYYTITIQTEYNLKLTHIRYLHLYLRQPCSHMKQPLGIDEIWLSAQERK